MAGKKIKLRKSWDGAQTYVKPEIRAERGKLSKGKKEFLAVHSAVNKAVGGKGVDKLASAMVSDLGDRMIDARKVSMKRKKRTSK